MKKELFRLIIAVTLSIICFVACTKDTVTETYSFYSPVYKTKEEIKSNIKSNAAETILQPGKLFIKDNFIYLNEIDKGVHIIDFKNPAQPRNVGFIKIPGNQDIAVRGNYLYADCYTDLVTIDISNPSSVKLKQFINGVFPHRYYTNYTADTSMIIQEWIRVDTIITRRFNENFKLQNGIGVPGIYFNDAMALNSFSSGTKPMNGTGGSMARFALLNDWMYTVSHADLKVFNTSDASTPRYLKAIELKSGDIETIFPYKDNLFIGSQTGMFIYNASNGETPAMLGQFQHVRSCDPVIADDNYAYITLRNGSFCGGFSNQLDVVDITNLTNPAFIRTYQLTNPKGLSKDGNLLFICDGTDGLKIFDASKANDILQINEIKNMDTYDVIAQNGIAITVARDGLYFIDYSNIKDVKLISKIALSKF